MDYLNQITIQLDSVITTEHAGMCFKRKNETPLNRSNETTYLKGMWSY